MDKLGAIIRIGIVITLTIASAYHAFNDNFDEATYNLLVAYILASLYWK